MKFWLGVTDNRWYDFMSTRGLDEANFWQPSGTPPFTEAATGMPFLFKLKRPNNDIAGGGYFVTYSRLPLSLAWEVFGEKNGAGTLSQLKNLLEPLIDTRTDPEIGCTVLANLFFLDRSNWIHEPAGWSANIVRGKMYKTDQVDGARIWGEISPLIESSQAVELVSGKAVAEPGEKYGALSMVRPRLGQSSFRVVVTDAYKRKCAITGENTLAALEAAHIIPYGADGNHDVRNGMLLRADFHRLFDAGLVGVTPDLKIKISPRIRETYFNGKAYYRLNDQPLSVVPDDVAKRPDPDRLNWHMQNRFQA